MKLAVYAIAKDEEPAVDRFVEPLLGKADVILVCDTGSADKTVEKLKAHGVTVAHYTKPIFRFDHARNESLDALPYDVDVALTLDLDWVARPGWDEIVRREFSDPEVTQLAFNIQWQGVTMFMDCCSRRHGHVWRYPCHEGIVPKDDGAPRKLAVTTAVIADHLQEKKESRKTYSKLLDLALEESPGDPRMLEHLARELIHYRDYKRAKNVCLHYLNLNLPKREAERGSVYRSMALACKHTGRFKQCVRWFEKAVRMRPWAREPWIWYAEVLREYGKPELALKAVEQALAINVRQMQCYGMEAVWGSYPIELANYLAQELGIKKVYTDAPWEWGKQQEKERELTHA